jgi:hypothetical protein
MDEFAKELTNSAKVIEENELGERRYVWRKLGPDHYFHSLAYCLLASREIGLSQEKSRAERELLRYYQEISEEQNKNYNPLYDGLFIPSQGGGKRSMEENDPFYRGLKMRR